MFEEFDLQALRRVPQFAQNAGKIVTLALIVVSGILVFLRGGGQGGPR